MRRTLSPVSKIDDYTHDFKVHLHTSGGGGGGGGGVIGGEEKHIDQTDNQSRAGCSPVQ